MDLGPMAVLVTKLSEVAGPFAAVLVAGLFIAISVLWRSWQSERTAHDATKKAFEDYKEVRRAQLEEELEDARKESEFWRNKIEAGATARPRR